MIADVTRTPELSPEVVSCAWIEPATGPTVGARFRAVNKVAGRPTWTNTPPVDIAADDLALVHFQGAGGPVDLDAVAFDSPAVRELRAAGVKLVVPLVAQGELIGLINLGPRLSEQEYTSEDRKLLESLAGQAAPALRIAQLVREQQAEAAERERIAQELQVATLIQQNFLPKKLPEPDGRLGCSPVTSPCAAQPTASTGLRAVGPLPPHLHPDASGRRDRSVRLRTGRAGHSHRVGLADPQAAAQARRAVGVIDHLAVPPGRMGAAEVDLQPGFARVRPRSWTSAQCNTPDRRASVAVS